MANVLVVYFSRAGTTLHVAMEVAQQLGADLDPIEEVASRGGALGYATSLLEAVAKGVPSIRTLRDPRAYDLVVLGTPVWAGTIASPVRAYLLRYAASLRRVAFFATMGGRGADMTLREMQLFCGATHAPTMSATTHEVVANLHEKKVAAFVQALRAEIPREGEGLRSA